MSFQDAMYELLECDGGGGRGGVGINDGVTLAKIDSNPHKTRPPPFLQPFYIETKFWLKTSKCSLAAAAACPDDFISILETFIGKL